MLDKLFNSENTFMRSMSRFFDATELNILWLLCCLPVITAGPATAAFYEAMLALVRDRETKVHLDFFRAFRRNLKRGFLLGLILAVSGGFLGADVYLAYKAGPGIYTFFLAFFSVLFLLWCFVTLYAFALLVDLDYPLLKTLALAFFLSLRKLPQTLLLLLSAAFTLWVAHLTPAFWFFVFGIGMEVHAVFLAAALKPYRAEEQEDGGTKADEE